MFSPDDFNAGECGASADAKLRLPGTFSGDRGGGGAAEGPVLFLTPPPLPPLAAAAGLAVFGATRRAGAGAALVLCSPVVSIASCLRTPGFAPDS